MRGGDGGLADTFRTSLSPTPTYVCVEGSVGTKLACVPEKGIKGTSLTQGVFPAAAPLVGEGSLLVPSGLGPRMPGLLQQVDRTGR